jgi:hypothetical protein
MGIWDFCLTKDIEIYFLPSYRAAKYMAESNLYLFSFIYW